MNEVTHSLNLADNESIVFVGCESGLSVTVFGVGDNEKPCASTIHLDVFDVGQLSGYLRAWAKEWVPEAIQALNAKA